MTARMVPPDRKDLVAVVALLATTALAGLLMKLFRARPASPAPREASLPAPANDNGPTYCMAGPRLRLV